MQVSFSVGSRRSGAKREIMELSEGGVLVAKPRKGLRKHFPSVVPTCPCRLKKTGNAKLHQKEFFWEKKKDVETKQKIMYLSFHCALFKLGHLALGKNSGVGTTNVMVPRKGRHSC